MTSLTLHQQATTTDESSAELTLLKARTYYEHQRTRWWYRSRFRSLLHCTSSILFYENVSISNSSSHLKNASLLFHSLFVLFAFCS